MGKSKETGSLGFHVPLGPWCEKANERIRELEALTPVLFKETAMDPNHEHYWGCKKIHKKSITVRCQVCGKEEKRKVDWTTVPKGEVDG